MFRFLRPSFIKVSPCHIDFPTRFFQYTSRKAATKSTQSLIGNDRPFDKILIANRGEIACRIIRTAKKLGVKTVAVYSDVDASGMHVREADEAYCIGKAPSRESYLNMEKIIHVAKLSGAQAIHPGYGFLSENAKFVDLVEASGLVFIGPSSSSMNDMGDKINSKRIAKAAGCFVIPGYEGEVPDEDTAARLAKDVGYPVMIKASAGGGGKGMRVAYNDQEIREGFRLSQSEARSSFGDDRMLIERFIEDPHHIEIQVLADAHGNVVAFPERECSVQRRNQKVVEESPSCLLTPATRRAMQEQAIMLCKATKYRSAGTVEMLADAQQNFYFLEMNTRLQVEHPVTELVSGEDLVEHMLWVASGRVLPQRFLDVKHMQAKGWAIESRVYAEDPLRGFLPSTGPLVAYQQPPANYQLPPSMTSQKDGSVNKSSSGGNDDSDSMNTITPITRIDAGVCEGSTIGVHYDPMIAKLCTHARTRKEAITAMEEALDKYVIKGVGNNVSFLRAVYRNEEFRHGNYSTKFIEKNFPQGFTGVQLTTPERFLLASSTIALHLRHMGIDLKNCDYGMAGTGGKDVWYLQVAGDPSQPDLITHRYRVSRSMMKPSKPEDESLFGDLFVEDLDQVDGRWSEAYVDICIDDVKVERGIGPIATVTSNIIFESLISCDDPIWGSRNTSGELILQFSPISTHTIAANSSSSITHNGFHHGGVSGEVYAVRMLGADAICIVSSPQEHVLSQYMLKPEIRDLSKQLRCPMPGTLISCDVLPGQSVEAGQQLCCVEAMKMVNVLRASKSGKVALVHCAVGSHLKVDQIILEFE